MKKVEIKEEETQKKQIPSLDKLMKFVYKEDAKVEIPSLLVYDLIGLINQYVLKERELIYELGGSDIQEVLKTKKVVVTDLGLQSIQMLNILSAIHATEIEKGNAFNSEEKNG